MDFEYNGNLLEEERVEQVTKEILMKYPNYNKEKAHEASRLEGAISEEKNLTMELTRLYNLMLTSKEEKDVVYEIYKDFLLCLEKNIDEKNNYFYQVAEDIYGYLTNTKPFPYLNKYLS